MGRALSKFWSVPGKYQCQWYLIHLDLVSSAQQASLPRGVPIHYAAAMVPSPKSTLWMDRARKCDHPRSFSEIPWTPLFSFCHLQDKLRGLWIRLQHKLYPIALMLCTPWCCNPILILFRAKRIIWWQNLNLYYIKIQFFIKAFLPDILQLLCNFLNSFTAMIWIPMQLMASSYPLKQWFSSST